jgi:hypothetical protein
LLKTKHFYFSKARLSIRKPFNKTGNQGMVNSSKEGNAAIGFNTQFLSPNTTFLHGTPGKLGLSESLFYSDKAITTYNARVLGFGDQTMSKTCQTSPMGSNYQIKFTQKVL